MPKIERQLPPKKPVRGAVAKAASVLDRIEPISLTTEGLKVAIYGRSGTGKTTLWSSFPKPILAMLKSGTKRGEIRSIWNVPGIEIVPLEDEAEVETLVQHQRSTGKYKTVVLDHITSYQDLVFKKVVGQDAPAQMTWGAATQEQWGIIGGILKERLADMLSLSCHVVLVAQEREFNTEANVADLLAPFVNVALSPSSAGWVGPAVDYLVQTYIRMGKIPYIKEAAGGKKLKMYKEVPQYCLRTGPHPVYSTKFRVPKGTVLPSEIVDADYNKIMALIEGKAK